MTSKWELLDSVRFSDLIKSKAHFDDLVEFHWRYYSELAFQRNRIRDQLRSALREKAEPYEFSKWQRIVRYKYSLEPLSVKGSLTDPGGRFNVGAIDTTRYPTFPALYIASDKKTALAEVLGQDAGSGALTPEEVALANPASITTVSISGKLESALDTRNAHNLVGFVNLIKGFSLSRDLVARAKKLGFPTPLVKTVKELTGVLRQRDWRNWPMVFDVPASSQIFGGLAMTAGIEGILYDSLLTNQACLAIFPGNFLNSSSCIELDDPAPIGVQRRLDSSNFKNFI